MIDGDFDELRKLKWEAGMVEHRTPGTDGFVGDPVEELAAEMIDAANYLDVMLEQRIIVQVQRDIIYAILRYVFLWVRGL